MTVVKEGGVVEKMAVEHCLGSKRGLVAKKEHSGGEKKVVLKERWRSIIWALKTGWWPKTGMVVLNLKKGDGGEKKGSGC